MQAVSAQPILYKVELPAEQEMLEALKAYAELSEVRYAEPNYIFKPHVLAPMPQNNPDFANQWYMNGSGGINARQGWDLIDLNAEANLGSVVVAVLDSGVDYTHEDLAGAMWINSGEIPNNGIDDDGNGYIDDVHGADVIIGPGHPDSGNPMDRHGHGTHVAGIVGAVDNDRGIVGVAAGVQIMAVKAARSDGSLTAEAIARGLYYAAEHGADVINMSFGGSYDSQTIRDALAVAFSRAVLVASAGNSGAPNEWGCDKMPMPNYPAAYDFVLGVMASDPLGDRAGFSNWDCNPGNRVEYEVTVPGVDILSTLPNNQYASWSGTSMAAPVASGLAALVKASHFGNEAWTNRLITGQVGKYGHDMLQVLTRLPRPALQPYGHLIYDAPGIAAGNDGDGIADAGETVQLGLFIRNRWGAAKNVTVTVTPNHGGQGAQDDPYVTIVSPDGGSTGKTINVGAVGSFATQSNGITYTDAGQTVTGITIPVTLQVAAGAPNGHRVTFAIRISGENALDSNDSGEYTGNGTFSFDLQNGVEKAGILLQNEHWTKDNLYIVTAPLEVGYGVTLTIDPGTTIRFRGGAFLSVKGTLRAIGTAKEKILFTADSDEVSPENSWGGILFNSTSYNQDSGTGTILDHAIIEKIYFNYNPTSGRFLYAVSAEGKSELSAKFLLQNILVRKSFVGRLYNFPNWYVYGIVRNCIFDFTETFYPTNDGKKYSESIYAGDNTIFSNNLFFGDYLLDYKPKRSFNWSRYSYGEDNQFNFGFGNVFYLYPTSPEGIFAIYKYQPPTNFPQLISLVDKVSFVGANSPAAIAKAIFDYNDSFNLENPLVTDYSTTPSPDSPAVLVNAVWEQGGAPQQILQVGEATLRLTFSRPMDAAVQPLAAFGPQYPYSDTSVAGNWVNVVDGGAIEWVGNYNITAMTGNGQYTLYVGGAVELDSQFEAPLDAWRTFTIDTFGSQAMTLQALGGEGKVTLSWFQDDYNLLAGYNIYRAESPMGAYTRLNQSVIPKSTTNFVDTTGNPGQLYWYAFSVVVSNIGAGSESAQSTAVSAASHDSVAPIITHTPITTSTVGQNITIRATVTDNVAVTAVRLFYRTTGSPSFNQVSMLKGQNNLWTATIPAVNVTSAGIQYYLEADDRAGNLTPYATVVSPVTVAVQEIDSDGDGVPDAQDAFPNDPAASVDSDGDGAPDYWNPGATAQQIANSSLVLDAYPHDATRWQNRAPVPTAPAITILSGGEASSQISHGDPDAGDTHTYVITSSPGGGVAWITSTGRVTYAADEGYSGNTSLTVRVTDGGGLSGYVQIAIQVSPLPAVRHWTAPVPQPLADSFWGLATLLGVN
ncbi:MAG: S8 family serine peptidase, partial [Desulfuromonadales bacterium]|nr:S8 family serine peptidase [Desulfuromonadales bacterium]